MTERVFVDTNIIVYVFDSGHAAKRALASEWLQLLWNKQSGRTSTQVLNELYVTLTRKLPKPMSTHHAWDVVESLFAWNPQPVDRELLMRGREIEQRYRLSWWDSLIVAAAQLQECDILLSENLQPGMKLGRVTVRSPFDFRIQEPRETYEAPDRFELRHRPRGRPPRARAR